MTEIISQILNVPKTAAKERVTRNQTLIRSKDDNSLLDLLNSDRKEERNLCDLTIRCENEDGGTDDSSESIVVHKSLFGTTTQYFKDLFSKLDRCTSTVNLSKTEFDQASGFMDDVYNRDTRYMELYNVATKGLVFAKGQQMLSESDMESAARKSLNRDRLGTGQFCDATISTGTREFPVHKCVLSVYSQFFSKLFTTEMKEKFETVCHVSGIDDDILAMVLDFIYTKEMWVADDQFFELLPVIDYLCIPSLQALDAKIERCLENLVTNANRMDMWIFAKKFQKENLQKRAQSEFRTGSYFLQCSPPSVDEILKVDEMFIKEVMEMLKENVSLDLCVELIIAWVKHDVENRRGMFGVLLDLIDVASLTESALRMLHREPEICCDVPKACEAVIAYLTPFLPKPPEIALNLGTLYAIDGSANVYKCDLPLIKQETDISIAIPRWTCIAKLERLSKRDGYTLVCRYEQLYILGGKDGNWEKVTDEVLSCNQGGNWKIEPSMIVKRFDAGAAFYQDTIYVSGGNSGGIHLTSTESFKNGQWTSLVPMQRAKTSFALVPINGGAQFSKLPSLDFYLTFTDSLYALGGSGYGQDTMEVYSIKKGCWKVIQDIDDEPSNVKLTATYDNKIYLVSETPAKAAKIFVCDLKQRKFVREKSPITALLQRHATLALSFPGLRALTRKIPYVHEGIMRSWKRLNDSDSDSDSVLDYGCFY